MGTTTKVSIYKHCARATVYHKTSLDVGCPEILLRGDTFQVRIGGTFIELCCQKRVAAGNLNVPLGLQAVLFRTQKAAQ